MSSSVIKHQFEWTIEDVTDRQLQSKVFTLRVSDVAIMCCASFENIYCQAPNCFCDEDDDNYGHYHQHHVKSLMYQLAWADCEKKPLLYSSEVEARSHKGKMLWADKTATPEAPVCSSKVPPKRSTTLDVLNGSVTVTFNFAFNVQGIGKDVLMPISALSLLEENVLSDYVIECEGASFNCHKVILAARSEVFRTVLTGSFKEATENRYVVKDFTSDVVKQLITFIYSDTVPEDAVSWDLFEAAKMYSLSSLQSLCLSILRKNLSVDNCTQMLEATFKHDLDEMFDHTMSYLKMNRSEVIKTDGWKAITNGSKLLANIVLRF